MNIVSCGLHLCKEKVSGVDYMLSCICGQGLSGLTISKGYVRDAWKNNNIILLCHSTSTVKQLVATATMQIQIYCLPTWHAGSSFALLKSQAILHRLYIARPSLVYLQYISHLSIL